ncbi:hypothetical protein HNO88_000280 [Novosphingobium chloroacetimidivorans]|uniref:Uncharacterized protein n=1 Tax=Novosphingobium chloroacetimidivorans TaxID=1428314 RepID=A0A7W7K7E1_9SPHN|nr:hypothetical protein [Novosphingobium chloroacetimidivorans]MBB4856983.1 hypothetical protein [Novosphingobium chloroacetimidivorans]
MTRFDKGDLRQAPAWLSEPQQQDHPWTWADIAFFCVASFISGGIAMAWFLQPAMESFT